MFTNPYVEGWYTFDHASLYGIRTVCDGEISSIVQFSSMEIPEPILSSLTTVLVILCQKPIMCKYLITIPIQT